MKIPVTCEVFHIYPHDEPDGSPVTVALNYAAAAAQPVIVHPATPLDSVMITSMLNGYVIACLEFRNPVNFERALRDIFARLECPVLVRSQGAEILVFQETRPTQQAALLRRCGRLH